MSSKRKAEKDEASSSDDSDAEVRKVNVFYILGVVGDTTLYETNACFNDSRQERKLQRKKQRRRGKIKEKLMKETICFRFL